MCMRIVFRFVGPLSKRITHSLGLIGMTNVTRLPLPPQSRVMDGMLRHTMNMSATNHHRAALSLGTSPYLDYS